MTAATDATFALRLEQAAGFDQHQRRFGRTRRNLGLAMLNLEQVRQIEALDTGDGRILSLYLDLAPERQTNRSYRIVFKDLVKDTRVRLDEALQRDLQGEAENHRAMAVALEQRANVDVVHGDAAQRLMALGGGLGARRFLPRAVGSRPTVGAG